MDVDDGAHDFLEEGDIFHAGHTATAVPVGTHADMIRANQFECAEHVLHELLEGRARRWEFGVDGLHPLHVAGFGFIVGGKRVHALKFGLEFLERGAPLRRIFQFLQVAAVSIDLDDAALRRDFLEEVVGDVPRMVVDRFEARVGQDDRCRGQLYHVLHRCVGRVRPIDHHAQAVCFAHELFSEICQTRVIGLVKSVALPPNWLSRKWIRPTIRTPLS
jgi:hypothetical protein